MEDESRERKRVEKKAREKEAGYQERLRNWESRERRKAKEYEKVSKVNFLFPKQIDFEWIEFSSSSGEKDNIIFYYKLIFLDKGTTHSKTSPPSRCRCSSTTLRQVNIFLILLKIDFQNKKKSS